MRSEAIAESDVSALVPARRKLMTQEYLADLVGCDVSTIGRLEGGDVYVSPLYARFYRHYVRDEIRQSKSEDFYGLL